MSCVVVSWVPRERGGVAGRRDDADIVRSMTTGSCITSTALISNLCYKMRLQ